MSKARASQISRPTRPMCPKCGRRNSVSRAMTSLWQCNYCGLFDDDPNEGGDYYDDPTKRLEAQEKRRNGRHAHRH